MLADNIKLFSKICQLTTICKSGLIKWNPKVKRIEANSGKNQTTDKTIKKCYLHTFLAFVVCLQTIISVRKLGISKHTDKERAHGIMIPQFQNALASIIMIALTCHLHTTRKQSTEIIVGINGLLQFAWKFKTQNQYSKMELLNVLFAHAMHITSIILPIGFVYGLHWMDPCKPSLAGYWLIGECSENAIQKPLSAFPLTKIIILLLNHWAWQFGYSVTIFVIAGIQILCAMSLQSYLRVFWNIANLSQHHSIYDTGLIYRNIQLLARLINCIQQGTHMTILIVAAVIIQSLSSTTLVRLTWSLGNLPYIAVFSIVWVDATVACVVCVGGLAGVYSQSLKVHQNMSGKIRSLSTMATRKTMSSKWYQRFWKSCPLIKLRFGGFNFVDRETPLRCIHMANELAVQLLLLGL